MTRSIQTDFGAQLSISGSIPLSALPVVSSALVARRDGGELGESEPETSFLKLEGTISWSMGVGQMSSWSESKELLQGLLGPCF